MMQMKMISGIGQRKFDEGERQKIPQLIRAHQNFSSISFIYVIKFVLKPNK